MWWMKWLGGHTILCCSGILLKFVKSGSRHLRTHTICNVIKSSPVWQLLPICQSISFQLLFGWTPAVAVVMELERHILLMPQLQGGSRCAGVVSISLLFFTDPVASNNAVINLEFLCCAVCLEKACFLRALVS